MRCCESVQEAPAAGSPREQEAQACITDILDALDALQTSVELSTALVRAIAIFVVQRVRPSSLRQRFGVVGASLAYGVPAARATGRCVRRQSQVLGDLEQCAAAATQVKLFGSVCAPGWH